jgi:hypothetical protein
VRPRVLSSWAFTLAEARSVGYIIRFDAGGVRCVPTPPEDLLAALRVHRDAIADFLAVEAEALQSKPPEPSWLRLGDSWWQDPTTGRLHWCDDEESLALSMAK